VPDFLLKFTLDLNSVLLAVGLPVPARYSRVSTFFIVCSLNVVYRNADVFAAKWVSFNKIIFIIINVHASAASVVYKNFTYLERSGFS
jgi:hypothetical protein